MSSYRTEQKKLLLEYLSAHKDNSLTIDEIIEGISATESESGAVPGKSTVYRLINKLLEEGKVLTGLWEFGLFHTFTDVPVDEGTLGVHEIELVIES